MKERADNTVDEIGTRVVAVEAAAAEASTACSNAGKTAAQWQGRAVTLEAEATTLRAQLQHQQVQSSHLQAVAARVQAQAQVQQTQAQAQLRAQSDALQARTHADAQAQAAQTQAALPQPQHMHANPVQPNMHAHAHTQPQQPSMAPPVLFYSAEEAAEATSVWSWQGLGMIESGEWLDGGRLSAGLRSLYVTGKDHLAGAMQVVWAYEAHTTWVMVELTTGKWKEGGSGAPMARLGERLLLELRQQHLYVVHGLKKSEVVAELATQDQPPGACLAQVTARLLARKKAQALRGGRSGGRGGGGGRNSNNNNGGGGGNGGNRQGNAPARIDRCPGLHVSQPPNPPSLPLT